MERCRKMSAVRGGKCGGEPERDGGLGIIQVVRHEER